MFFHFPATRYNQNWYINQTENDIKLTGNIAKNEIKVKKIFIFVARFLKTDSWCYEWFFYMWWTKVWTRTYEKIIEIYMTEVCLKIH